MDTIPLKEVISEINNSVSPTGEEKPFSIEFIKWDKRNKNKHNGKVVSYTGCVKAGLPASMRTSHRKGFKILSTGEIKTCNIFLITSLNGKSVVW